METDNLVRYTLMICDPLSKYIEIAYLPPIGQDVLTLSVVTCWRAHQHDPDFVRTSIGIDILGLGTVAVYRFY